MDKISFLETEKEKLLKKEDDLKKDLENRQRDKNKVKEELNSVIRKKNKLKDNNAELWNEKEVKIPVFEQEKKELKILEKKLMNEEARLDVLQELDNNYEGYYYGVKNVLKNTDKFTGVKGVLASLINVDKKYLKAVETALNGKMQNIVVEYDTTASRIIKYLKKNKLGYATFLPLNLIKGKEKIINNKSLKKNGGYIATAPELITYDSYLDDIIHYLLGNTIIVADIDAAVEINRRSNSRYKIVTLAGEIIRPGGAMTGGSKQNSSKNLITRAKEKEKLIIMINKLKDKINNKKKKVAVLQQEITSYGNNIEKNREKIHTLELDASNIIADLNGIKNKINEVKKILNNTSRKSKQITQELLNLKEKENKFKEQIKLIAHKSNEDNGMEKNRNKITELEKNKEIISGEITELKIKLATEEQKIENYRKEKDRLAGNLNDYNLEYKQKCKDITDKKNKLNNLKEKIKDVQAKRIESEKEIKILEKNISLWENKVEHLQKIVASINSRQEDKNHKYEETKEKLHKIELKLNRLEDKCDRYRGKLEEEYEINPEKNNFTNRINISDYRNASKKIREFKNSLKSLGPVNSGAKNEYKKIKEKVDYLQGQRQDLEQARNSIIKFIKEIEKTMNNLFYSTFCKVKEEFEDIFSELFSGGKACLYLDNEDDLLNTGVEISAQPPGKKLKKLSLMSGGERALTAIALVFAFLNVHPSPFYILDEIDAPLDDANVIRFSKFINKYAQSTQFIIITHRKYMMTQAGIIYGVTMEDMGVSKLISLDINNTGGKIKYYVS